MQEIMDNNITDWKDHYIRLLADFENYRKSKAKEIETIKATATKDLLLDLIGTLDDIHVAYSNSNDPEGFAVVYNNLLLSLKKYGFEPYGKQGEKFDSDIHEAIGTSNNGKFDNGTISEVIKYGYKLNNFIIRHAQVIVEC